MKIALAQINFIINDFRYNTDRIIDNIQKAKELGAELIIFSELSTCGYAPLDLLDYEYFVQNNLKAIEEIKVHCKGIAAIVGAPSINDNPQGKALYNSAYFLHEGAIKSIHHKALLPTYDIFDEYRYFEPNTEFHLAELNGRKIAITVCEDLWDDQPAKSRFERGKLYKLSPMQELSKGNPDFIVNIAASPFSYDSQSNREQVFLGNVKRFKLPVFYVNQTGANTDLIFDGGSMVLNSSGEIYSKMAFFEEDFQVFELEKIESGQDIQQNKEFDKIEKINDALVLGIKDYFRKMGFTKATLGLSGGIDSAVTAALAVKALGEENVFGLLLPSKFSSDHSVKDAIDLANNLGIAYEKINIEQITDSFDISLKTLFKELPFNIAEENIQARVRGTLLMAISNKFGHILLNTSNKSEAAVGFSTLYGDMNGGLSVLGDVYKTDVFKLADFINSDVEIIPQNTITKPPSAELRPDQKDSDSLPDYDILDQLLFQYIEKQESGFDIIKKGFEPKMVEKIISLVNKTEYKRYQTPPILRVSSKAFGIGRRMPLVAKY